MGRDLVNTLVRGRAWGTLGHVILSSIGLGLIIMMSWCHVILRSPGNTSSAGSCDWRGQRSWLGCKSDNRIGTSCDIPTSPQAGFGPCPARWSGGDSRRVRLGKFQSSKSDSSVEPDLLWAHLDSLCGKGCH